MLYCRCCARARRGGRCLICEKNWGLGLPGRLLVVLSLAFALLVLWR